MLRIRARQLTKILHTLAAAGLVGGLGVYMVLLVTAPEMNPAAYADFRGTLKVISNFVIMPSMAIALVSGLLSMIIHQPFQEKGWVWIKAATGILMFKGVTTIDSAKADYGAALAQRIEEGTASPDAFDSLLQLEWWTLVAVMGVAVANFVLGVWRPKRIFGSVKASGTSPATKTG